MSEGWEQAITDMKLMPVVSNVDADDEYSYAKPIPIDCVDVPFEEVKQSIS